MQHTIVVIEDVEATQKIYRARLEKAGYAVRAFSSAEPCLAALEAFEPSAICLDIGLPGITGLEALARIRQLRPDVPVVILTAEDDIRSSVQAMKMGAVDYLVKPVDLDVLEQVLRTALDRFELVLQVRSLRAQVEAGGAFQEIVGQTQPMARIASQIGLVLHNDVSVCLMGETGTGKELIARAIHQHGPRGSGPFVAVNCGAIPAELQESQYFGHEKGAFTGAVRQHRGFFEEASGGTIFLDEVAELSPESQVKLLRVLQDRRIRRVGSSGEIEIDVRVLSATHRDLKAMMAAGEFREDLYYRLVVFPIQVPPLRDRRGDIPLLAGHYLRLYSGKVGATTGQLSDEALACLIHHDWPGNVRELQNTIQFALLAARGGDIRAEHLPAHVAQAARGLVAGGSGPTLELLDPATGRVKPFERLEYEIFLRARAFCEGNVTRAAEALGVGRATIYRRLQQVERVDPGAGAEGTPPGASRFETKTDT